MLQDYFWQSGINVVEKEKDSFTFAHFFTNQQRNHLHDTIGAHREAYKGV